jgi:NAD(P)-dependent dehydrogenase (short-subunit alcohol dehydrogenase family)
METLNRLLDRSVVFSFDRSGYLRHARQFTPLPRMDGQTVLVTGANSGLGLWSARAMAKLGARVVLLCRDERRGEQARAELAAEGRVELQRLDVSSLADVRRFAAQWSGPIDALVNNAGVLPDTLQRTAEGHELTFATNVLGPHLLTTWLMPSLRGGARVVTVSSGGMYPVRLSLRALQGEVKQFDGVAAYAQTKRAEVLLNERLATRHPQVTFSAMHPGWADTPSVRTSLPRFWSVMKSRLRTPEEGADTIVWLAATRSLPSGKFWFDRREARTHLLPGTQERPGDVERLWELVEATR